MRNGRANIISGLKSITINREWTLFLDRDGVINRRLPGEYVRTIEEFEFLPGVLKTMDNFSKIFGHIIIVTNQQGIGKGLMTDKDLEVIHEYMMERILYAGGSVDKIYYCEALADYPDNCRKPSPAMAYWAKNDFPGIEFDNSLMVGDSISDVAFGQALGMKTVLVGDQLGYSDLDCESRPDFILKDLVAVEEVLVPGV